MLCLKLVVIAARGPDCALLAKPSERNVVASVAREAAERL